MPSNKGYDREALRDAAWSFYAALKAKAIRNGEDTISQMTAEEQIFALTSHGITAKSAVTGDAGDPQKVDA